MELHRVRAGEKKVEPEPKLNNLHMSPTVDSPDIQ